MTSGGVPAPGSLALVIGAGRSGLALARYLTRSGVRVRLSDARPAAELDHAVGELPGEVDVVAGTEDAALLDGCASVFASPGVPWDHALLTAARARGIPVGSEIGLFLEVCPAPVVGVTGTNGKTTTTALCGAVLERGPRPVLVGGNIGSTVLDRVPEISAQHWVVLELSSFQLESVDGRSPHIAVVLNLTPDHLDRHGSMDAYAAAKSRILRWQTDGDWAVLNGSDARVRAMAGIGGGRVVWFDRHHPIPQTRLLGAHNRENVAAAAAVGRIAGLSDEDIAGAVAGFPGVEHRLELVGEWGGVRWFNDSKATNPDAARTGLAALAGTPLVLIAGGRGEFDLDPWLDDVNRAADAVVLIGESAGEIARRLDGPEVSVAGSIDEAVAEAGRLARPGGAVLLSPAHKSFDMFRDYEERGRQFKAAVIAVHGPGEAR